MSTFLQNAFNRVWPAGIAVPFNSLAPGLYSRKTLEASGLRFMPTEKALTAQVLFAGTDDNAAVDYAVYGANHLAAAGGPPANQPSGKTTPADDTQVLLEYLGGGTATVGTLAGLNTGTAGDAGMALKTTEALCDTLTWASSTTGTTPKGPAAVVDGAFGEGPSAPYSPADNTAAMLFLASIARFDYLVVVPTRAGQEALTTTFNALMKLNRP